MSFESPRVLKELATELGPGFAHLFQQSLDTGEIPKEWHIGKTLKWRFFSVLQTTASCCKWSKISLGPGFVWCLSGHCPWPLVFSCFVLFLFCCCCCCCFWVFFLLLLFFFFVFFVLFFFCFFLYINDISTDIDSEIRLFVTKKLRIQGGHIETSERYRSIGMLGKEMGYEISTCQMQCDANNKKTDQKDPCFIYSGGNGPRKFRKYQVPWGHYHK